MKVLIAGAGIRGKRIAQSLFFYDFLVEAFIDNDNKKWNTEILDGIRCYPVDYFVKEGDNYVVFVSPQGAEDLYNFLKKYYKNVLDLKVSETILQAAYNVGYEKFFPIGHYYSLYPVVEEILEKPDYAEIDRVFEIAGVDLCEPLQRSYLDRMINLYRLVPKWKRTGDDDSEWRYRLGNPSISCGDAVGLFCMLNIIKPKNMIEVGSGWSSAMTLDVNEHCLKGSVELTFIEPYPELLTSLLKPADKINLIKSQLQEVDVSFFEILEQGDILFIDSTHVSKSNSDVNYLFFEIFPRLKPGVIIHLHDIFYPFEYPHKWLKQGMVWNELFLLRGFLQYNNNFEILYFQNMMEKIYRTELEDNWPIKGESIHGGSFWMRKK